MVYSGYLNVSTPGVFGFDDCVLDCYFRNGALSELQGTLTIFLDSV